MCLCYLTASSLFSRARTHKHTYGSSLRCFSVFTNSSTAVSSCEQLPRFSYSSPSPQTHPYPSTKPHPALARWLARDKRGLLGKKKQTFKDLYLSSISLTFCMSSAARATTRQSVTIPHACLPRHKASLLTFTFSMRRKLKDYSSPCGGNARDRGQLQKQGWRRGCCCCWYRGLHQVTSVMV